ncbi:coiled-coil domain-containing protein 40-like, partial [Sitophilus oryzae]|uniref:Coiled-coil domain-containing protein 40-like n=1 Tax=Sitophilus oryzae TaxID=7048 RepID=A0A6J2XUL2_SITOR
MTEEKVQEKAVLDPDHEILKRFQEALTDHYTRQIDQRKKKELLGVEVYEAQQVVCRQQKTLDEITQDVENINAAKQEVENQIKERKEKFKEAKEAMVAAEKYNMELQNEINSINLLISQ